MRNKIGFRTTCYGVTEDEDNHDTEGRVGFTEEKKGVGMGGIIIQGPKEVQLQNRTYCYCLPCFNVKFGVMEGV